MTINSSPLDKILADLGVSASQFAIVCDTQVGEIYGCLRGRIRLPRRVIRYLAGAGFNTVDLIHAQDEYKASVRAQLIDRIAQRPGGAILSAANDRSR